MCGLFLNIFKDFVDTQIPRNCVYFSDQDVFTKSLQRSQSDRPSVIFTNISQATFCTKAFSVAFLCLHFVFVILWGMNIGEKIGHEAYH